MFCRDMRSVPFYAACEFTQREWIRARGGTSLALQEDGADTFSRSMRECVGDGMEIPIRGRVRNSTSQETRLDQ
jgi:hypothetical protein